MLDWRLSKMLSQLTNGMALLLRATASVCRFIASSKSPDQAGHETSLASLQQATYHVQVFALDVEIIKQTDLISLRPMYRDQLSVLALTLPSVTALTSTRPKYQDQLAVPVALLASSAHAPAAPSCTLADQHQ